MPPPHPHFMRPRGLRGPVHKWNDSTPCCAFDTCQNYCPLSPVRGLGWWFWIMRIKLIEAKTGTFHPVSAQKVPALHHTHNPPSVYAAHAKPNLPPPHSPVKRKEKRKKLLHKLRRRGLFLLFLLFFFFLQTTCPFWSETFSSSSSSFPLSCDSWNYDILPRATS